jgi:uncharacterized protein
VADGRTPGRPALCLGLFLAFWCVLVALPARADVAIPPAPKDYFNDYASLVSSDAAARLNDKLREFDGQTSNQILVAIFPELPEPSLEDFTVRTAQAWRVGQKKLDNGAVLFVFVKDHKTRIEVGYGLEGALPDARCKDILEDVLAPRFRQGDYAGGLEAAVDAMIAATKGEYKAPARASRAPRGSSGIGSGCVVPFFILFFVLPIVLTRFLGRTVGRTFGGGGWWSGGGGGWGGGGWSGGGGGGFSGGGGSFGGGGASGGW